MPTLLLLLTLLASCVTPAPRATFGIQPDHAAYVPARIAVLPCRPWPVGARFPDLPLTRPDDPAIPALCAKADEFVLAGFNQQPYMKGFSPKSVLKALSDAKQPNLLSRLDAIWAHDGGDCQDCTSAPGFYVASRAQRQNWLLWLSELARSARNVDAILIPFVTYAQERSYLDRGLRVAERRAAVVLLLIDTNNGQLLWAGGRDGTAQSKVLPSGKGPGEPPLPPWSEVEPRLFTEDLWREFPGRQIF